MVDIYRATASNSLKNNVEPRREQPWHQATPPLSKCMSSNFTVTCWGTSQIVHHFDNNGFRFRETLNYIIRSGIWGPSRHLLLKITNSFTTLRLRKPLKTSTMLVGHGIWTRILPNASHVHYHGATSLGRYLQRSPDDFNSVHCTLWKYSANKTSIQLVYCISYREKFAAEVSRYAYLII